MIINQQGIQALLTSYGAAFKNAFDGASPQFEKITTIVPSSNQSNLYAWMGQFPQLRQWTGDRQLKNIRTYNYQVPNVTYEGSVEVQRESIEDDLYGIYTPMMAEMGLAARMHADELVFGLIANGASGLCYDGLSFFNASHATAGGTSTASNYDSTTGTNVNLWCLLDTRRPLKPLLFQKRREYKFTAFIADPTNEHVFMRNTYVYGVDARVAAAYGLWQCAYGSVNDINSTNVQSYVQSMMALKSDEGKPLGVQPNVCVVGPSNWAAARALFLVPTLTGGAANPNYGLCEVVLSSYLT